MVYKFAAALVLTAAHVSSRDYASDFLSCQMPTQHIRLNHQVDFAVNNDPFLTMMKGGVFTQFDAWLRQVFELGVASGLDKFTNKQVITGNAVDSCFTNVTPMQNTTVFDDFNNIIADGSDPEGGRSVLDALIAAANMDWTTVSGTGRKIIYVYSSCVPDTQTLELPPYDEDSNCEAVRFPTVQAVKDKLEENHVSVVFVVPADKIEVYKEVFDTNMVVAQVDDPDVMFDLLAESIDVLYCGPIDSDASTPLVFSTQGRDCMEDAVLQLMHVQDVSYSYDDDFVTMRSKFPDLFNMISTSFYSAQYGLSSFSDKPIEPFGYSPYDYCYREDLALTANTTLFEAEIDSLQTLSGFDWRESQMDAMLYGALSNNVGWGADYDGAGRRVLKVSLMATDAGAHPSGTSALPKFDQAGDCFTRDYPANEDVASVLDAKAVYPVFMVTPYVYNSWVSKVANFPFTEVEPAVLSLDGSIEELHQALLDALSDLCEANARRLAA